MDWVRLAKAIGIMIFMAIQLVIIAAATDSGVDDGIGDICTIILLVECVILLIVSVTGFIYGML